MNDKTSTGKHTTYLQRSYDIQYIGSQNKENPQGASVKDCSSAVGSFVRLRQFNRVVWLGSNY